MSNQISILPVIIISTVILIGIVLFWLSVKYTGKAPKNPLMKEIQHHTIQQMARESDIRKSGRWQKDKNIELVLLNPDSTRIMSEKRQKKFNPIRHSSKNKAPELVPITDYIHQELVWELVYGNKKKGRRYDLRPLHGGQAAAIIEIYDYDPQAGFCALFDSNLYYVHDGSITDSETNISIAHTNNTPSGTGIKINGRDQYFYQRGDGVFLTEEPEKLKPDEIQNAEGSAVIQFLFNYRIKFSEDIVEKDIPGLLMMLFYLNRNPIIYSA